MFLWFILLDVVVEFYTERHDLKTILAGRLCSCDTHALLRDADCKMYGKTGVFLMKTWREHLKNNARRFLLNAHQFAPESPVR